MPHIGRIELLLLSISCLVPIGVAAAALVVAWLVRRDRVPCPYCAERIRREARVCRFCGRELPPSWAGTPANGRPSPREERDG